MNGLVIKMKELKLFVMAGCPHCKRAEEMITNLCTSHPEYKKVPIVKIDETKEPELAAKYDYYLVPTFFVGEEKIAEGVPTEEGVEKAFKTAYNG